MRLLAVMLLGVVLVGCGNQDKGNSMEVYWVGGKPLECLNLYYRLSCNWEEYNKL